MKKKQLSWLIAGIFTVPAAGVAQAQTSAVKAEEVQQVTVSGIRASVRNALAVKEASNSMVEVIASEDIGKLPDTTIAESLARLPGLSSGLDRGNASQVVARGLGPRFIGATLNGRELASAEPNRAVRFEQFPSESVSGAMVYKTQSAELVEGGIATTIDLQTVSPLKYSGRQASVKADALYYAMSKDVPGAKKTAPRLGGIYIDQFDDRKLGVALAFSYQDQPSVEKNVKHFGFNEDHSGDLNGDGKVDKTPWGWQDGIKRGTNERSSVLGKVEWKPNADALVTGDAYFARAKIKEPGLQHWSGDIGNWDGWQKGNYTSHDIRDGYVVGGTVKDVGLTTNDTLWTQDMDTFATGVNGKFNAGDWKLEADLSSSRSGRDSAWRDLRQFAKSGATVSWSFTGNEHQQYSYGQDTGNPANFGPATLYVDTDGHLRDRLDAIHLSAAHPLELGPINRVKFGARVSDREKKYHQTTWSLSPTGAIADSDYERVTIAGMAAPFIALKDFMGTTTKVFGANPCNADGRAPTQNDLLSGWRVKERSSSLYAQGDMEGEVGGRGYRGNVGLRVVHTSQTGEGMQSLNGAAPTAVSGGASYTEFLPSLNLIFNMDEQQERQVRFSVARAMSRAPLDEMRGSRNLNVDPNPVQPLTGSAGNPELKPMMANQVDLAYQWYFGKGSLLSAGAFYKKLSRYIGITGDTTTINGRGAVITRSVNGEGGNVRGVELVYQQSFDNGFGVFGNYSYTSSDIKENFPTASPFPIEGLMKHNGGVTLWYENSGYEGRLSANYHSAFVRNPTWGAGQLINNEAETYVTLNLSKQLTKSLQVRFGIDNLTNQKVVYTTAKNPFQQEVTEFGRRFNLGLSYKL
ncbi:TonB-dependent receptor [Pseudoduganella namucuonensis]|uniref:TonB-dependent receptor n=1 Tax=Pseudoduganella namucuonensis TaxID=1035707 RepID=A0A1I7G8Z4_9BURK|nr:TonB-dependent receptor [Pseudoduganella namucuonensis]SFU44922.1 TonB-dependent receptor [Pseudoduganella namucuonensis]